MAIEAEWSIVICFPNNRWLRSRMENIPTYLISVTAVYCLRINHSIALLLIEFYVSTLANSIVDHAQRHIYTCILYCSLYVSKTWIIPRSCTIPWLYHISFFNWLYLCFYNILLPYTYFIIPIDTHHITNETGFLSSRLIVYIFLHIVWYGCDYV